MENDTQTSWVKTEWEHMEKEGVNMGERLPSLVLPEGRIVEIEIDWSKPFDKWLDKENGAVKKIIPVNSGGQKLNFWLNTRNPLYKQLLALGKEGKSKVRVIRTGTAKETRYSIVE